MQRLISNLSLSLPRRQRPVATGRLHTTAFLAGLFVLALGLAGRSVSSHYVPVSSTVFSQA